ncbi:MAG: SPFH domain-containing protein [Chloroflexi bacterium]|nr:SPFH domain-containing protein [Chloroflexota bacterium]MCI0578182.1 SPFH domain-containing protein [Chloroflexota bacterium]MCI0649163.1 SPFH domain-containing protein [Chloroflexota bacterium]MCI0725346.1 SPFH domain-containing protein [Chloroflexota bacterium]
MTRRRSKIKPAGSRSRKYLVIWLMFVGVLLAFFLRDRTGVRLGLTGSYLWLMAFSVSLGAGLLYYAQFTLPLRGQESWYEGFRLVLNHYFRTPVRAIRSLVTYQPIAPAATAAAQGELSPGFLQLKAGFVESHKALAVVRGASFVRTAGPGFTRLGDRETVGQVIDLHRHLRRQPVKAMTRDGIPVDTGTTVTFHIRQLPEEQAEPNLQYPTDPDAVFQVSLWGNFNADDSLPVWSERISRLAADLIIAELARHTLDELYQPGRSGAPPLEAVKGRVKKELAERLAPHGIEIISVGVGQFKLPEKVVEQRINNWRANWQQRIYVEREAGNAEAFKRIKLARARAQIDIIENITDSIETMRRSPDANLTEIVALRMIEAMEEAVADDTVQALVPQHVIATLRQINGLLQEGSGLS